MLQSDASGGTDARELSVPWRCVVSEGSHFALQTAAHIFSTGGQGVRNAGQAGSCLHTMTVLQAYQADLLKELDEGEGVNAEDIKELRKTADLSLRATKETAHANGRSLAALVAAERHLWLTMSDIKDRDGSSSWMPRFHLQACSAMLLVLSSKGGKKTLAMEGRSWDARHPFGGL